MLPLNKREGDRTYHRALAFSLREIWHTVVEIWPEGADDMRERNIDHEGGRVETMEGTWTAGLS